MRSEPQVAAVVAIERKSSKGVVYGFKFGYLLD